MQARLSKPASELKTHYDVVVVGSGYGGGVAASRLARCGQKVAVLERGREYMPGDFPADAVSAGAQMQVTGQGLCMGPETGLFDVRLNPDVHVLMACGLGGTSLINANVCLSPDPRVFDDKAWPEEVRGDRLLPEGLVRARHMLRPEASPATMSYEKVQALGLAAEAFDRSVEAVPLHVTYESGPTAGGVQQEACTQCGDCCGGCNVGAKTTVASTYLADACSFGAEVFTRLRVRSVAKQPGGTWRVNARVSGTKDEEISVTAGIVVLAAGTLGSTEILLRSQAEGLATSHWLGSRFTSNGDAIAIAYNNDVPVNGVGVGNPPKADVPPVGQAVNGLIDLRGTPDVRDGLALVDCALPSAFAPLLPAMLAPGGAIFGEREPSGNFVETLSAVKRAGESLVKGAYEGAVHNTQTFLAVGHDAGNGVMRLEQDRVFIEWTNGPRQRVFQHIEETLKTATAATGGAYMRNPASEQLLGGNLMTVHPLGGCTMGADASSGVVNHKGQVFDASNPGAVHKGLYVCDGAVVPCPLGIHPLLTITALAERAMMLLAIDYGWDMKEEDAPWRPAARTLADEPMPAPAGAEKKKGRFAWLGRWGRKAPARAEGG